MEISAPWPAHFSPSISTPPSPVLLPPHAHPASAQPLQPPRHNAHAHPPANTTPCLQQTSPPSLPKAAYSLPAAYPAPPPGLHPGHRLHPAATDSTTTVRPAH